MLEAKLNILSGMFTGTAIRMVGAAVWLEKMGVTKRNPGGRVGTTLSHAIMSNPCFEGSSGVRKD